MTQQRTPRSAALALAILTICYTSACDSAESPAADSVAEIETDAEGDADVGGDAVSDVDGVSDVDASPDAEVVPDTAADIGPDAVPDTAPDAVPDTAPDAVPDTAPDAVPDTAPDAVPDTAADTGTDTAEDADTAPDVVPDVVPDATPDAFPDTTPDAAPDAIPDAVPDAALDTAPDVPPDAAPDTAPDTGPVCTDECPGVDVASCVDNAVLVCGDHDADPCLEWSAPAACAPGLSCVAASASCEFPPVANYLWNVHAGAASSDWVYAVVTNEAGDIFVAGTFVGDFMLGPDLLSYGNTDIFLARISPAGEVIWARDIGGGNVDTVEDLAIDSKGDLILTGWFTGSTSIGGTAMAGNGGSWEVYLAKYDQDGDPIWGKLLSGPGSNEGLAVAVGPEDSIYLAGAFEQTWSLAGKSLAAAGTDAYLARFTADGDAVWSLGVGGASGDRANGVAVDGEGNVTITGSVGSFVDFDPGAGTKQGGPGLFVAQYSPQGQYRWHLVRSNGSGQSVVANPAGQLYVVGNLTGSVNLGGGNHKFVGGGSDGFLMKVSQNGAYMWSSATGSIGPDRMHDVAVDPLGNVLCVGEYSGPMVWEGTALAFAGTAGSANMEDAVVARFSPAGALLWVQRFGGPGQEWGQAVTADPSGHVVWAGHFSDTMSLGDEVLTSNGFGDLVVVRMAPGADGGPACFAPGLVCTGHGACHEGAAGLSCTCDPGYADEDCGGCAPGYLPSADGATCVAICVSAGLSCEVAAHCEAVGGEPTCACDAGFAAPGCASCSAGYYDPDDCSGAPCACVPDCRADGGPERCDACSDAPELWPGEGMLSGFLVGDGSDAIGGCGGAGPDHALRFELTEPTRVAFTLATDAAVLYLRADCAEPETQLACDVAVGGGLAELVEVLPPGSYTLWIDSQDGTGDTYTLSYSFRTDPCPAVSCSGELKCATDDWLATACQCPVGTEPDPADPETCAAVLPPIPMQVAIDISNTCDLSVTPDFVVVPPGREASLTFTDQSADYYADVELTPGVSTFGLPPGESWTDPKPWCRDGVSGYADISASEGCSEVHRLHITCLP
jgi:hypothetical protein